MERVRNRAAWERQQAQVKRKEEEEAERERSEWRGEEGCKRGEGKGRRNVEERISKAQLVHI